MATPWSEPLLDKFRAPQDDLKAVEGRFTNFLGLRTKASLFPAADRYAGSIMDNLPIPDDRVYGGAMEYAAVLSAIERRGDLGTFNAVELGAGWGPWISAAGVVCQRAGFAQVNLVGVEASLAKVATLRDHMAHNGLVDAPGMNVKLIHGAAWSSDTVLQFPKELPITDYGAAVSASTSDRDYRGFTYETEPVQAYCLDTICRDLGVIDYMHWDLQGAEGEVATAGRNFLDTNVRQVFIGTHSRLLEGELLKLFHSMGWELLWEQPCGFTYKAETPRLEGMTHTDGEMLWRNPKL